PPRARPPGAGRATAARTAAAPAPPAPSTTTKDRRAAGGRGTTRSRARGSPPASSTPRSRAGRRAAAGRSPAAAASRAPPAPRAPRGCAAAQTSSELAQQPEAQPPLRRTHFVQQVEPGRDRQLAVGLRPVDDDQLVAESRLQQRLQARAADREHGVVRRRIQ